MDYILTDPTLHVDRCGDRREVSILVLMDYILTVTKMFHFYLLK